MRIGMMLEHKCTRRLFLAVAILVVPCLGGQPVQQPSEPEKIDKKLGERLIRDVLHEGDVDVMDKVIRLMATAAQKLEIDFDSGPQTQNLQKRAMSHLDEAIRIAAANRRPLRSRRPQQSSDKRKRSKGKPGSTTKKQSGSSKTGQGGAGETASQSTTSDPTKGGELRETRRAWGLLPSREREELIQGADEQFLERYREWIERYYRALQETKE